MIRRAVQRPSHRPHATEAEGVRQARRFSACLEGGELVTVKGWLSPPFGAFPGTSKGPESYAGQHRHTLVFLPDGRLLATLSTSRECKALAAELARAWFREGAAASILNNQR